MVSACPDLIFLMLYCKLQLLQQLIRIAPHTSCDLSSDKAPRAHDSPHCGLKHSKRNPSFLYIQMSLSQSAQLATPECLWSYLTAFYIKLYPIYKGIHHYSTLSASRARWNTFLLKEDAYLEKNFEEGACHKRKLWTILYTTSYLHTNNKNGYIITVAFPPP